MGTKANEMKELMNQLAGHKAPSKIKHNKMKKEVCVPQPLQKSDKPKTGFVASFKRIVFRKAE